MNASGWATLLKPGQFCPFVAWFQTPNLLPRAMERTLGRRNTSPFYETAKTRILMKRRHIYSLKHLQIHFCSSDINAFSARCRSKGDQNCILIRGIVELHVKMPFEGISSKYQACSH